MCKETKKNISDCMYNLMRKKPIRKITVQDIMDETHMTRQSFYYHFKDVYDVIEYTSKELLSLPEKEDLNLEEWINYILNLICDNEWYFRRILDDIVWSQAADCSKAIFIKQLRKYFKDTDERIIEFISTNFVYYLMDLIDHSARKKGRSYNYYFSNLDTIINVINKQCA